MYVRLASGGGGGDRKRQLSSLAGSHKLWRVVKESSGRGGGGDRKRQLSSLAGSHKLWRVVKESSGRGGAENDNGIGVGQLLRRCPSYKELVSLLKRCGQAKALVEGRILHAHARKQKLDRDVFIGNWLLRMYGDCGSMDEAQGVFDLLPNPNLYSWTLLMNAYIHNDRPHDAVRCYDLMQRHGSIKPDYVTFVCALNACGSLCALEQGRKIHAAILEDGCEGQVAVGSALINFYKKCGSLEEARNVFNRAPRRDVVLWNTMIAACAQNGRGEEALSLFDHMKGEGMKPNQITYVCALDACTSVKSLVKGQELHASLMADGCVEQSAVGNSLIRMYGKCGRLLDAENVFCRMHHRNVISWNSMITACMDNGRSEKSLGFFHQMKKFGIKPNQSTYLSVLEACTSLLAFDKGKEIHAEIVNSEFEGQTVVGTALIKMYSKCGSLKDAKSVFLNLFEHDVISWTAMIAACAQNGRGEEALDYFYQMKSHGLEPTLITYVCAVDACASMASLVNGQEVHAMISNIGWDKETVVGNALVNMYGKCGSLQDARTAFYKMPKRDRVSWNAMIAACAQNGYAHEALELFDRMRHEGFKPDHFTFVCALDACASTLALEKGCEIHHAAANDGCEEQIIVATALINMYGKCGSLDNAKILFNRLSRRDLICWNAMLAAFTQNGHGIEALELLDQMQLESINPNQITFVCALDACASLNLLEKGQDIHAAILKCGYNNEVAVGNALINMYGNCQSLQDARDVFYKLPLRDIVSWNAMITSCIHNGNAIEALDLFERMMINSLKPNHITFVCALDACASLAALEKGVEIHLTIESSGFMQYLVVGNALLNMYGKCGSLRDANNVFKRMSHRDVVTWNTMIAIYAQNGKSQEALDVFKQMMYECVKPNQITFLSVLAACNHTGRVDDGREYFNSMNQTYGIAHLVEHCVCMIDILGRAGYLDEAEKSINNMRCRDDARVWLSLLAGCRIHGDVARGMRAAAQILKLDPENAAPYVLLSNTYATADNSLLQECAS